MNGGKNKPPCKSIHTSQPKWSSCYPKHCTFLCSLSLCSHGHVHLGRREALERPGKDTAVTYTAEFCPPVPSSSILWTTFLLPDTLGLSVPLLQEGEEKVLRNGSTRASWNVGLLLSIRSCVLRDQRFYPSFPTSSNNSWRVCRQPQHLIWQHRPPRAVILCSELVGQGNRPGLSKTHKYPRQLLLDVFDSIKEHRWSSHKMSALSLVALVTLVSTGELGWLHCTSSWLFLGRC